MQIKITKTHNRALDPRTIVKYYQDSIHDFSDDFAQDIIKNGFGIEIKKQKVEIENKAIFESPENKENSIEEISEEKTKKRK